MTDTGYPVGREQIYYRREFLNQPGHHGLAAVQAEIAYEPPSKTYAGVVEGHVQISDCNRTVKLVFTLHSEERTDNDIAKIRMLDEVVHEFRMRLFDSYVKLARARGESLLIADYDGRSADA